MSSTAPQSPYLRWTGDELDFVIRGPAVFVPRQADGALHARTTLPELQQFLNEVANAEMKGVRLSPRLRKQVDILKSFPPPCVEELNKQQLADREVQGDLTVPGCSGFNCVSMQSWRNSSSGAIRTW
jgi:hypothetical protein